MPTRPAMPSRTRASLALATIVAALLGTFGGFLGWAAAQPSSGWENTNPIENWHLPSNDPFQVSSTIVP